MTRNFKANLKVGLLLAIPLILFLLPADLFDKGQSICLSVLLFQTECYGCGITRAIMHLIHFEFLEAYYYNPLAFIVLPIIAWLWIGYLIKNIKILRKDVNRSQLP